MVVSSVTLGEPLKQMYVHQYTAAKRARKVPSDFGDMVVLKIFGTFCRNASHKQSVCFWATVL